MVGQCGGTVVPIRGRVGARPRAGGHCPVVAQRASKKCERVGEALSLALVHAQRGHPGGSPGHGADTGAGRRRAVTDPLLPVERWRSGRRRTGGAELIWLAQLARIEEMLPQNQERGHQLGHMGVLGPDEQRFSYPSGIQAHTLNSALLGALDS